MHHEHNISRRQRCEAVDGAADLIDETFPAGRRVARRRFPEIAVDFAEFGDEVVMPPSGPGAKILLAKQPLPDRIEPEGNSGFKRPPRRTAADKSLCRQSRLERGEGCGIADVGRRVRAVDDAAGAVDRRVPDQPEIGLVAHRAKPASLRAAAGSRSRRVARRRRARRRSGRRSGAAPATPCPPRMPPPPAPRQTPRARAAPARQ